MHSTWVLLAGVLAVGAIFLAVAVGAALLTWAPLRQRDREPPDERHPDPD